VTEQPPFAEKLRRDLATKRRPRNAILEYRCVPKAHPLLWIVAESGQFVPVTKSASRDFGFEGWSEDGEMRPRTLDDWADDDELAVGSCDCGSFVGPRVVDVRSVLRAGTRKVLLEPVTPGS
jgi:hypothetical protein